MCQQADCSKACVNSIREPATAPDPADAHARAPASPAHRPPTPQQQAQYLHQFVLHAALDAVDEAMWATKELHLKVGRSAKLSVA